MNRVKAAAKKYTDRAESHEKLAHLASVAGDHGSAAQKFAWASVDHARASRIHALSSVWWSRLAMKFAIAAFVLQVVAIILKAAS